MSTFWRASSLLALAMALAAIALRLLPASEFVIGPMELTPATASLAAASIFGLVIFAVQGRPAAVALENLLIELERRPSLFESAIALLVAVGAVLRFAHLGEYPLNGDEHLFVNSAYAGNIGGVWAGVQQHLHPPANFYLLHLILRFTADPVWLRMPALFAGLFLIWISARFAKQWLGPREGLVVGVLAAFSPALVELSRVCRNYTPAYACLLTGLYFFVLYLRDRRPRDLVLFSLFEALSILWLYSVLVPLLAVNLVLFWQLLRERGSAGEWRRVIGCQLPVGILFCILYFTHIRPVGATEMAGTAASYHGDDIFRAPTDYLLYLPLPLMLVYQYLLVGPAGLLGAILSVLGGVRLWRMGRGQALSACLLSFGIGYAFRFAEVLPFSGTRQSSFVYPFVFLLTASGVSSAISGFSDLRRRTGRADEGPEPVSQTVGRRRAGLLAAAAFLMLFVNLSLGVAEGTVFLDRQEELPTKWEDLERVVSVLRERSEADDLILMSYQGLCAYQAYLNRSAMTYAPGEPATLEAHGLRFHYSPESGWFFTPDSIVRAYLDARRTSFPDPVGSVWVARGSGWPWEKPLRDWFHHDFPEVRVDDALAVETEGWLLRAEAADMDSLGPRVAEREQFYAEDFIRSQISRENRRSPDYFLSPPGRD